MNTSRELDKGMQISRNEILYLMHLLGAKALLGVDRESGIDNEGVIQNGNLQNSVIDSLIKKGIFLPESENSPLLDPKFESFLETLFFPKRAFVVARHRFGVGDQIFYIA